MLVLNFSQVNANTSNGGPADGAGGIANGGTATINASQVNGNTVPMDSSGDQGAGGGIATLNFAVSIPGAASGGFLTITFSQVRNNIASGMGGGILEAANDATGMATLQVLQSRFVTRGPPFCQLELGDVGGGEPGVVMVPSGAGLVASPPS